MARARSVIRYRGKVKGDGKGKVSVDPYIAGEETKAKRVAHENQQRCGGGVRILRRGRRADY